MQTPPPPTPAEDPQQPDIPPPGHRPYGSVRLAAPVGAAAPAGPRTAVPGHWQAGRVHVPLLSIAALRAGRRRLG